MAPDNVTDSNTAGYSDLLRHHSSSPSSGVQGPCISRLNSGVLWFVYTSFQYFILLLLTMFDKCNCKRLNKQLSAILCNLVLNFNMVTLSIHLMVHTILSLAAGGTWGID